MNKRLAWADIAKGIGIILVVFAHTLIPKLRDASGSIKFLWIFIYNFHMPLFFFISGWLFEKNIHRYTSKTKFIVGKARLLMLPYLVFSLFAYVVVFISMKIPALAGVLSGGGYGTPSAKDMILGILFYYKHVDQHLWFVYSLFIVFMVNIILKNIMKAKPILILLLALYISKAFIHYPAILDYTASDLLFFSLARVMLAAEKKAVVKKPSSLIIAAAVFLTANIVYSFFYVKGMLPGAARIILYTVRSVCSAAGIITVCSISEFISAKQVGKLFTEAGQYSYDIYLMHAPFLVSGLMGILLAYSPLPAPICCAVVTVIGIMLPYLISKFIIRKFEWLSLIILGNTHRKSEVRS